VTLTVAASTPLLSYAGATGTFGSAFSVIPTTLNNRGAAITACEIKSGTMALPSWASVHPSTCVISGTPDAALASTSFTLQASNSVGTSSDANVTLQVAGLAPVLSYASSTGNSGTLGSAMSITPSTLNPRGASVSSCAIKSGTTALPAWASVNPNTCVISGTPTNSLASTQFTLQASNSVGTSADATVTLEVAALAPILSYASATGTSGTVGVLMSVAPTTLNNRGSTITNCAIKASTTALPAWATLDTSDCSIDGTPTTTLAATEFTVIASNSIGASSDATVTLTVAANTPLLSYTGATGTSGTFGNAMSVSPTTLNNRGASVTACGVKSGSTALPSWASVNSSTCVISGTPDAILAATEYTIVATNSAGTSSDATVTLQVAGLAPVLSYASSTGTSGTFGSAMTVTPSTLNPRGANVTACAIKSGTTALPAWASVAATTCVISGTPTGSLASTEFTLQATNANGTSSDATVTLVVAALVPTLSYSGASGVTINYGSNLSVSPTTLNSRGAAITACGIKSGTTALPAWASIHASTCVISGTPTEALAATEYTLQATNSIGASSDATVTLTVNGSVPSLSYASSTGKTGGVNSPMSVTPSTFSNGGAALSFCGIKPSTTALPAWASVNTSNCVISGTPTAVLNATTYTMRATNSYGNSSDATVQLNVTSLPPTLSYATSTGKKGYTGQSMSITPSTLVTNGANVSACGIKSGTTALPTGLSIAATTCVISGTPSAGTTGDQNFTIVATNAAGTSSDAVITLNICAATTISSTANVADGLTTCGLVVTGSGTVATITSANNVAIDDLVINANASVVLNRDETFVNATVNGTLTAAAFDSTQFDSGTGAWTLAPAVGNGKLVFTVTDTLSVGAAGKIDMEGKGYGGGISTRPFGGSPTGRGAATGTTTANGGGGAGKNLNTFYGGGGSYGSKGGYVPYAGLILFNEGADFFGSGENGATYGSSDFTTQLYLGSGGGFGDTSRTGGAGGGGIKIMTAVLSLASGSQILARGSSGYQYGGSGSGGTIVLNATTLSNNGGTISVRGGRNSVTAGGVGYLNNGGFGRIYITPAAIKDGSNNVNLTGFEGYEYRIPSGENINTLTLGANSDVFLYADGASHNTSRISTLTLNGASSRLWLGQEFQIDTLNLTNGTITSFEHDNLFDSGTAAWTNSPSPGNGQLVLNVTGTATVGASGKIDMDGKGYDGGTITRPFGGSPTGRGAATGSTSNNGGGGAGKNLNTFYGGGGSYGSKNTAGSGYGLNGALYGASDFMTQLYLGSGGGFGDTNRMGGAGGGAIKLTSNSLSLASGSQIISRGINAYQYGGSGSGGTLNISAVSLTNSGALISSYGGRNSAGTTYYNHGGNGRLALVYDSCAGSFCPHSGNGTSSSYYVPQFTSANFCVLSGSTYTCKGASQTPPMPTSLTRTDPVGSPDTDRNPTIRVSNSSFQQGQSVRLYSNSNCSTAVGSAYVGASQYADVTTVSLADGSYSFYAKAVDFSGEESDCSTATASYVVDNTDASVPVLTANTSSPNTDATPTFNIAVQGGANFAVDESLTLHEGADCTGAAVSSALVPGAVASTSITRSTNMAEVSTNFRVKVTSTSGNTACSNAIAYRYDNTAPTYTSLPVIAVGNDPYSALDTTPPITITRDATDSGAGVDRYEYSIGTTSGGGEIISWSELVGTSLQPTGLSLSDGTRYYVNIRVKDLVALYSTVRTTSWVVDSDAPTVSLTVAAAYPTNGAKFMDWVKNDGADIYSATDAACANTETTPLPSPCIHGGPMRKVVVTGEASCSGLSGRDELGVFDWTCVVKSGTATFYSSGFKSGKAIRDLLDFTGSPATWKNNRVFVTRAGAGTNTYASASSNTWTNTLAALPNNSASAALLIDGTDNDTTGPDQAFTAGTLLTLGASRNTQGYNIDLAKIGIVLKEGVELSWYGGSVNNTGTGCAGLYMICVTTVNNIHLEGIFGAGVGATKSTRGMNLTAIKNSSFGPLTSSGHNGYGIYLSDVLYSKFSAITASSNASTGLYVFNATDNTFSEITASSNLGSGNNGGIVFQQTCHRNSLGNVTVNSNTSHGLQMYSTASNNMVFQNITANSNGGSGFNVDGGGASYVVGNIIATNNAAYGAELRSLANSTVGNITANSNGSSGVFLYGSTGNGFGTITANSNLGATNNGGILIQGSSHSNSFGTVTAQSNASHGVMIYSTASNYQTFSSIEASNNGGHGIHVSTGTSFSNFGNLNTSNNTLDGINLAGTSKSKFGNVTANSNGSDGVYLSGSSDNLFESITVNSNLGSGTANGGLILQASCHRNTFGNVSSSNNSGYGVFLYSTASNDSKFSDIFAQANGSHGISLQGTNLKIGNITSLYNNTAYTTGAYYGIYMTGVSNVSVGDVYSAGHLGGELYISILGTIGTLQMGRVITQGNKSTTAGAMTITSPAVSDYCHNTRIRSLQSSNNLGYGFSIACSVGDGVSVQDYMLLNNNQDSGFLATNAVGSHWTFNNVMATNNKIRGFEYTGASKSNLVLRNFLASNNEISGSTFTSSSKALIHNSVLTHNGYGAVLSTSSTNKFSGSMIVGSNSTGNCSVTSGTNAGLTNSTCTTTGADGSSSYTAGHLSTAKLFTARDPNTSFVGSNLGEGGDDSNTSDGDLGTGTGTGTFASSFDFYNFEHNFRQWGGTSTNQYPLNSSQRASCAVSGINCRIWDYSLSQSDTLLLNRSGNFSNINHGASLTSDGTFGTAANTFTAGATCPVQVLGDQWIETPAFTYNATVWTLKNAFQSAGSSTACTSGSTCVQRFLKNAGELSGDTISYDGVSGCSVDGKPCVEALKDYVMYDTSNCSTGGIVCTEITDYYGDDDGVCEAGERCTRGDDDGVCETGEDCFVGDEDGLCESGEQCVYQPNFGPYQGHFAANEANPYFPHSSHECNWNSNSGLVQNVKMYGYPKNGR